jgi:hypothetical protein
MTLRPKRIVRDVWTRDRESLALRATKQQSASPQTKRLQEMAAMLLHPADSPLQL